MKNPFICIALLFILQSSCKVTEDDIVGTYHQKDGKRARLIIKKDKTFEFAGPETVTSVNSSANLTNLNFLTTGTWQLNKKRLFLNSSAADSLGFESSMTDSISRFTSITSFNFWSRYGDPVSIRYILFVPAKPKPHFGNSLFLFAQDFKSTDTLKFHFDDYPDFIYPGTVPYSIGNNNHKITLREPYRPAVFCNTSFLLKKNKLRAEENKLVLNKKK